MLDLIYASGTGGLVSIAVANDEASVQHWLEFLWKEQRRAWLMWQNERVGYVQAIGEMWGTWYGPMSFPSPQESG